MPIYDDNVYNRAGSSKSLGTRLLLAIASQSWGCVACTFWTRSVHPQSKFFVTRCPLFVPYPVIYASSRMPQCCALFAGNLCHDRHSTALNQSWSPLQQEQTAFKSRDRAPLRDWYGHTPHTAPPSIVRDSHKFNRFNHSVYWSVLTTGSTTGAPAHTGQLRHVATHDEIGTFPSQVQNVPESRVPFDSITVIIPETDSLGEIIPSTTQSSDMSAMSLPQVSLFGCLRPEDAHVATSPGCIAKTLIGLWSRCSSAAICYWIISHVRTLLFAIPTRSA